MTTATATTGRGPRLGTAAVALAAAAAVRLRADPSAAATPGSPSLVAPPFSFPLLPTETLPSAASGLMHSLSIASEAPSVLRANSVFGAVSPSLLTLDCAVDPDRVEVTPLDEVIGASIDHHLGPLSLHVVRETTMLREFGGLERFVSHFINDMLCIARAQAAARGGNAIVSYRIRQFLITDQSNRNQAQCVLSLNGDVARLGAPPRLLPCVLESMV
jgi:hypothetical protein